MNRLLPIILIVILSFSFSPQEVKIDVIDIPELKILLADKSQPYHVINFWATWCKPCIQELPHFEKMRLEYASKGIRFSLISLDFKDQLDSKVKFFIAKKGYTHFKHYLMGESDTNAWIDFVSKDWQGEIPATLFINHKKHTKVFQSGSYSESSLRKTIEKMIR